MLINPKRALTSPNYIKSTPGLRSADGERGGVWGVNVLSGYILVSRARCQRRKWDEPADNPYPQAKELQSHLVKSPTSLPYPPRIIYVSSKQASAACLPTPDPLADPQLLAAANPYDASKYVADLVIAHLDTEMSRTDDKAVAVGKKDGATNGTGAGPTRRIRCLLADPGIASTGLFVPFLPWIMQIAMVLLMHLVGRTPMVQRSVLTRHHAVSHPRLVRPYLHRQRRRRRHVLSRHGPGRATRAASPASLAARIHIQRVPPLRWDRVVGFATTPARARAVQVSLPCDALGHRLRPLRAGGGLGSVRRACGGVCGRVRAGVWRVEGAGGAGQWTCSARGPGARRQGTEEHAPVGYQVQADYNDRLRRNDLYDSWH